MFRDELLTGNEDRAPLSRILARKVLASLKMLIKDAMRRGNVAQNVVLGVSVQLNKRDRRKLRVGEDIPTPVEVRRMIEASTGRARALLVTACHSARAVCRQHAALVEGAGRACRAGVCGNPAMYSKPP